MNKNTNSKSRKITLSTQTLRRLDGARKGALEQGDAGKASATWFFCNLTNKCEIKSYAVVCA